MAVFERVLLRFQSEVTDIAVTMVEEVLHSELVARRAQGRHLTAADQSTSDEEFDVVHDASDVAGNSLDARVRSEKSVAVACRQAPLKLAERGIDVQQLLVGILGRLAVSVEEFLPKQMRQVERMWPSHPEAKEMGTAMDRSLTEKDDQVVVPSANGEVSQSSSRDVVPPQVTHPAHQSLAGRELALDGVRGMLWRRGDAVDLRRLGVLKRVLCLFASTPNTSLSKAEIVRAVWGMEYQPQMHDPPLSALVMKSRRLIGDRAWEIIQATSEGYRFVPPRDFVFLEPGRTSVLDDVC
ncbi:MAG: hypothetical protein ACTHU0_38580 [Kofleriaceae bacterium]